MYKANEDPATRDKVPIVAIAAVLGYFSWSVDDCAVWIDVRSLMSLCINGEFADVVQYQSNVFRVF